MRDGQAYWLYVREPVNITVVGYVVQPGVAPSTYSLVLGWNLVGFKPPYVVANETVGVYLTSISGKYSFMAVYDNLNSTWIKGDTSLQLAPGEGMWVLMTQAATLVPH